MFLQEPGSGEQDNTQTLNVGAKTHEKRKEKKKVSPIPETPTEAGCFELLSTGKRLSFKKKKKKKLSVA